MTTALVLGASGVSGWGVFDECRSYPTKTTFKRIIGCTNRPLDKKTALVPEDDSERVELYSGIDLSLPLDKVVDKFKIIPNIDEVEMVYFCAYTGHGSDHAELKRANVEIMVNSVKALESLCPKMSFFALQTGGKVRLPSPIFSPRKRFSQICVTYPSPLSR